MAPRNRNILDKNRQQQKQQQAAPDPDRLTQPTERAGTAAKSRHTPEDYAEVCELVAGGDTEKDACKKVGMVARTFRYWVQHDQKLREAYHAARELSSYAFEEEAVQMAYELRRGEVPKDKVRAYEVAMQQLRWSASKRNPGTFSDRHANNMTVPIQINTGLNLGQEGASAEAGHDEGSNAYQVTAYVPLEPNSTRQDEESRKKPAKESGKPET